MIPSDKKELDTPVSIVLDILSEKPRLTVKDLYEFFLEKSEQKMTLQGFYKMISQLINQLVLVKEGKMVSLNASWIYNLVKFTEKVKKLYLRKEAYSFNILLNEGESKTFTFETVKDMDNFWHHVLFLIVSYYEQNKHSDKNAYVYTDHGWFQVIRVDMEKALVRLYQENKMNLYHIIGSDTFLDKYAVKFSDEENCFVTSKFIPTLGKNYYGMVIGDFLIKTKLPNFIYEEMEEFYQKVTNINNFNSEELNKLIIEPAKTKITITKNKKKAQQFRKLIKSNFKA